MKVFRSGTDACLQELNRLLHRYEEEGMEQVEASVKKVLMDVREQGDQALLAYTEKWDGIRLEKGDISLPKKEIEKAFKALDKTTRDALQLAHDRIRVFHEHQVQESWEFTDEEGNILGQRVTPLDRVGVYVPGGKAAYPSSVLMNIVPAKVAGVKEIYIVTPPGRIQETPAILAAAKICGVDRVFQVGGAQAVAALAYGTETIPSVDKIVGPGNLYVATAKRLVYGSVDIDMIAGPSEVLIVTDGSADPAHLAADLLAQAEHDEKAVPILVSTSEACLQDVLKALDEQMDQGPWKVIASRAIQENGRAFSVQCLEEAMEFVNRIAPEHLELALEETDKALGMVRHAGAIFLGPNSAESLGDYLAGPNHVLPTTGTARFSSPLGVYDFVKRSSILKVSNQGLSRLGPAAAHLAKTEGLFAHAHALDLRMKAKGKTS